MIGYWEIKEETAFNGGEIHRLYVEADVQDVGQILVRLGNYCGRPQAAPSPYTYSLSLLNMTGELLLKAEAAVFEVARESEKRASKPAAARPAGSLQRPAPAFVSAAPSAEKKFFREEISPAVADISCGRPESVCGPELPSIEEPPVFAPEPAAPPEPEPSAEEISAAPAEETIPAPLPENLAEPELPAIAPLEPPVISETEPAEILPVLSEEIPPEAEPQISAPPGVFTFPPLPEPETPPPPPPPITETIGAAAADISLVMPALQPPALASDGEEPSKIADTLEEELTRLAKEVTLRAPAPAAPLRKPPSPPRPAAKPKPSAKPETPAPPKPPAPKPAPAPAPKPEAKAPLPEPEPVAEKAAAPAHAPKIWRVRRQAEPGYNFESLLPGANRFAHAAAMAVVENPGGMYNPLLFYGPPGTGKTHFSHAIAAGLSGSLGADNVFITDGARFSMGVERLLPDKGINELEAELEKARVLVVDDIHLMAISDQTQSLLARWFNGFISRKKQVILTSAYPPKCLAKLETGLGIQFSQGWLAELRLPGKSHYDTILGRLLESANFPLSRAEMTAYFTRPGICLADARRLIRRAKTLEKALEQPSPGSLFEKLRSESGLHEAVTKEEMAEAAAFRFPAAAQGWGIFCPKGSLALSDWAACSVAEQAAELKSAVPFKPAFKREYSQEELMISAFWIAASTQAAGASGALVVGPPASVDFKTREDFFSVVYHMLDSMGLGCACLAEEKLKSPAEQLSALLDIKGE